MVMKTPGVYVVEKSAFPNSVVQVATAVPAFVGYTEMAMNGNLPIDGQAFRITSMAEFHTFFGGPAKPKFLIKPYAAREGASPLSIKDANLKPELPQAPFSVNMGGKSQKFELVQENEAFALYGAMQMFFQNGGGPCYILSCGSYEDTIDAKPMMAGIEELKKEAEPTMLLIPDVTRLSHQDAIAVQQQMLKHCGTDMKNRFALLDIPGGYLTQNSPRGEPVQRFRDAIGTNNLDYGAAYYPWVSSSIFGGREFTFENIAFSAREKFISLLKRSVHFDPDISAEIDRVGTPQLTGDMGVSVVKNGTVALSNLDFSARDESSSAEELVYKISYNEDELPGTLSLDGSDAPVTSFTQADLDAGKVTFQHDASKGVRGNGYFNFTITDGDGVETAVQSVQVTAGAAVMALPDIQSGAQKSATIDVVEGVDGLVTGSVKLVKADALDTKSILADDPEAIQARNAAAADPENEELKSAIETAELAALAKHEGKTQTLPGVGVWTVMDNDQLMFAPDDGFALPEVMAQYTLEDANGVSAPREVKLLVDGAPVGNSLAVDSNPGATVDKTLRAVVPLYQNVMDAMATYMNTMAPSAAMAGVYTAVDSAIGVWKAPANVSLNSVVAPTVSIGADEQENLNVSTTGKSINAIRSFAGEGVLVWGARTLDGNSLDWRYINVRRTMIMIEESIRLASKAYVFEPNVAQTWVTIKSMIENFLTSVWRAGGLAGAVPSDAFSVHIGLGETMTPNDVLEGIMRITVLVAVNRPAEFIEVTFQQQMQKS